VASDAMGQTLEASISVNRDLTSLALMRLLTAASVFWLAVQLCRDGSRANRLIAAIAMIGAAYAVYGLVAAKTGQIPWLDIPASDGRVTSTFVNHNSYATFAGIGLIAFIGLLLRVYERHAVAGGSWRFRLASFIDTTGGNGAWLLIGSFMSFVALLLTGSRGGVLSTGLGLAALGVLALCRGDQRSRRPTAAIGFLVVLLIATLFVFGSLFADKFSASGFADSNRLAVFLLTARSILDLPLLGYGYGTFSDVFPMYRDQSISIAGAWTQAHDSYIEQLQGLGVVFGGMLIAVLALLALRCVRGAIERQENATMPCVAVGVACLLGVHSTVDFSLQIQAVTLTFMAVLGAGVAQATSSRVDIGD
jgi:O-antigen ligase